MGFSPFICQGDDPIYFKKKEKIKGEKKGEKNEKKQGVVGVGRKREAYVNYVLVIIQK